MSGFLSAITLTVTALMFGFLCYQTVLMALLYANAQATRPAIVFLVLAMLSFLITMITCLPTARQNLALFLYGPGGRILAIMLWAVLSFGALLGILAIHSLFGPVIDRYASASVQVMVFAYGSASYLILAFLTLVFPGFLYEPIRRSLAEAVARTCYSTAAHESARHIHYGPHPLRIEPRRTLCGIGRR